MSSAFKLQPAETPIVILAEGCFGTQAGKTATGVLRYGAWPVSAVLDSGHAGKTVGDVIPGGDAVPIVATLAEALVLNPRPKALLIGTAPMGGGLPDDYRRVVLAALDAGLHVISGLHIFLNSLPDVRELAAQRGLTLWDVRDFPPDPVVTRQLARPAGTRVLTMVGSDCSVGKMYTALELTQGLEAAGKSARFVATGQTGILIAGDGVPLDRVIGDFMAGQVEAAIDRAIGIEAPDWVVVEGQGSLLHPAYSGVTLSLLHGSAPDAMVLCHNPRLKAIRNFERQILPSLKDIVALYETAATWIKPAPVIGIAMNTSSFSETEAQGILAAATAETGLPATDPVRYGVASLVAACAAVTPRTA